MPKIKQAPSTSRVVLKLKPDLEAEGEQELARLEIAALLSRPDSEIPAVVDGSMELEGLSLREVEFLASRLAFTDHLEFDGKTYPCSQARIERCYGQLASVGGNNGQVVSSRTRRRNDYLTHGFHKYKAKFFPRLARGLINIVCGKNGTKILDPFVGSGTALVEAFTMGIDGSGVDIDPLSVFISRQKVGSLVSALSDPTLPQRLLRLAAETPSPSGQSNLFGANGNSVPYMLPEYIRSKLSADIVTEIERDVTTLRAYSHGINEPQASALAALAISHSIATKISLRWMGTGDSRFSLSVNSRSILAIFKKHLTFMSGALATATALSPSTSKIEVLEGSALALPFGNASFDGIVTSPPYVPASSGRETYLRSRGPSLIALDLVSESEIPVRESRMVGSVLNRDGLGVELPPEITELVEWMRPQRARAPKAEATGAYFAQLDCALREMARVLKPGGRAAMVLASVHTMYDLLTRETVRVMDMPVLVEKLLTCGEPIPLRLTRSIRMELAKMDFAARPASKGGYSEAILFFEHV